MGARTAVVIPARGGSARIPRKNIKIFNGRPAIAWPIESCLAVPSIDVVAVSTDDREIGEIARACGVAITIDRPVELASSTAGTAAVIKHALDQLVLTDDTLVMCLYPTAPLTSAHIEEALQLARGNPDRFVVTVGRHRSPLERALQCVEDELMALSSNEHLLTRTQDLPQRYFDAGKLYVASAAVWRERETMMEVPFVPLYLPDWAAVDMDDPDDWEIAEALHRVFVLESS